MTKHARTAKLSTLTPPQVDAIGADIYTEIAVAERRVRTTCDTIHRLNGERFNGRSQEPTWPTLDSEARDALAAKLEAGSLTAWDARAAHDALTQLDERNAIVKALDAEAEAVANEYASRPWSRFFIVEGGHIHSSMSCSTCRITTRFGWLPELSGLTEAEAVAAHGPLLCTVCYPSAPVAWTIGKPKPERCEGSGKAPKANTTRRVGMRSYGACDVCDEVQTLVGGGYVRAHKPKK